MKFLSLRSCCALLYIQGLCYSTESVVNELPVTTHPTANGVQEQSQLENTESALTTTNPDSPSFIPILSTQNAIDTAMSCSSTIVSHSKTDREPTIRESRTPAPDKKVFDEHIIITNEQTRGETTQEAIIPQITQSSIQEIGSSILSLSTESKVSNNNSLEEEDSADAHFLSFEEWKRLKGVDSTNQKKESKDKLITRPSSPSLKKDSIGEDMEIDISNFFGQSEIEPEGKLYKDKFNYASFDCAATIVKTNSEAQSATSILFENKDSYLLNPCSAPNKFVVIELCQDILVDGVVMGNFEFFSSTFKSIQISVSDVFPVPRNGWRVLGRFNAKDVRDYQTFPIENPIIWAKYIRVEILDYYGSEFYCPLSVVRVHGRTMMQEYKQEEALEKVKNDEELIELTDNELISEKVKSTLKERNCTIGNDTYELHCGNPGYNNSMINQTLEELYDTIKDLEHEDLTNDECSVSLPQLKFEEFFESFANYSQCGTDSSPKPTAIEVTSQTNSVGTQESIYKNIMKRLSLLESNASLSVLYIEEQSKLLSNAFINLEKRQSLKFDKLITAFNTSIFNQLENLSNLYTLFQKQTDILLNEQRAKHNELLGDAYKRIENLSSDLRFQKFLSFFNGLILTCILIYVILTRDTYIDDTSEYEKYWFNQQKQRITSTGLRLKTNLKKFYNYNSDGGDESLKSTTSEENILDLDRIASATTNDTTNESGKPGPKCIRSLTPEHSDSEKESDK